jgi:hypothetical protein
MTNFGSLFIFIILYHSFIHKFIHFYNSVSQLYPLVIQIFALLRLGQAGQLITPTTFFFKGWSVLWSHFNSHVNISFRFVPILFT